MGLLYARALVAGIGVLINLRLVQSLTGLSILTQLGANLRCLVATGLMILAVIGVQQSIAPPIGAFQAVFSIGHEAISAVDQHELRQAEGNLTKPAVSEALQPYRIQAAS